MEVPDIGDEEDVEIIEILVSKGDSVAKEDGLITLETDKATMDVPCPDDGEIVEMLVSEGDKVSQGSVIAKLKWLAVRRTLRMRLSVLKSKPQRTQAAPRKANRKTSHNKTIRQTVARVRRQPPNVSRRYLITRRERSKISTSFMHHRLCVALPANLVWICHKSKDGPKNRILKEDVQDYVKYELSRPKAVAGATGQGGGGLQVIDAPKVDFSKFGEVEEVQLSRIQRKSGPNLHRNWVTIPHVTQFDEADITELENFRKSENEVAKKKDLGFKITPLVFIMKACAKALREFPTFNSSLV